MFASGPHTRGLGPQIRMFAMAQKTHARITKTVVDTLAPGQTIRDTELSGFGVRRQRGAPVYFLQKRIGGKLRWLTIGTHGQGWTATTARTKAMALLGDIANGEDPALVRQAKTPDTTVASVSELFLNHHGPRLKRRTREEYKRIFRLHILPSFGGTRIDAITRADVARFHAERAASPGGANFALACLSKFMSWAEDHGLRPENSNPCRQIKKYHIENRERFLGAAEITRLGDVLADVEEEEGPFVVAALRLLILTGARLNEILTLKWSYVDTERAMLFLPDSKTGKKSIRLSRAALTVLTDLPKVHGNPYVLPGRREGGHMINLQKPWRRIRERAGLCDVRIHDLRHSFASVAAASGGSLPMIGKLLGHKQPQTTARYAHLADDPLRELNERTGTQIAELLGANAQ